MAKSSGKDFQNGRKVGVGPVDDSLLVFTARRNKHDVANQLPKVIWWDVTKSNTTRTFTKLVIQKTTAKIDILKQNSKPST